MKRWRRRSDWTASRRVRGGLVVLGAISLGLLVNTVHLFALLNESRMAMEDSIREDAI